ncbi:ATPase [Bifidobacterium lemurum]|uniref:ATPase n=2 Tax=Bifidobacterium lemurum TaxID=1603886 RepID=A0A261FTJ3_9BIFI|nr:ATPase [Bifidobacterium lemurum]QOL33851.1 ATP-binding protein [Bifidobacterium lemurum]
MERSLMQELVGWKDSPRRKPLILNGARQVGKTWLLKRFGSECFENVAYVSLDNDALARSYFDPDFDVRRIISSLSLQLNVDIQPNKTLIVLDEIQSCPKAITSLKYFCEDASEYAVAAAGSLLGISANEGTGFPVGKVDTFDLGPMTLLEFMEATGEGRFVDLVRSGDTILMNPFKDRISEILKRYYVVGGMPGVVSVFAENGDYREVRILQSQILADYERDFAKHVPARLLPRMMLVWESIPRHLSQENKKFVFGQVRKGARASDFEEVLVWLAQAGLITKAPRVDKPGLPLSAYTDSKAFKVFLVDVGLLGAMSGLAPETVLEGDRVYTEFKGALTEQYVCQQLVALGLRVFYWSAENSSGEIDFLTQSDGAVYPIEVKAEENLHSKSLRAFAKKYEDMRCRRFSLAGFRDEGWMRNVPLWAIGCADNWL